ncbi:MULTISPECIES: D-glycerate dehydrogenase [unclassified Novosphingobium]|uniref:2-hydroxyacid dehydrogenase n=1 Tax=unclassified Novosphingobium TaxID=2644732 RepID=UPI000EB910EE|nr:MULTISPECIES: D-glycerate dehydrogenase [unclassified Novosphingobium]HCF24350.1 D-glycerate dehydrogenase [Novosphingobium sp.]HQV02623.1 D-glycerate dehydrogenase [Novosphingobium sp.]
MTVVTDNKPTRRISGKPRVQVTRHLLPSVEARMGELFDVVLNVEDRPLTRDELIAAMRDCDVIVPTVTDRIDGAMLEAAGDRLGLIANFGAGIEHIDLTAARARKVIVTNTPGVFTDDTADLTMMLILSVPRRLGEGSRLVRDGKWTGWAPTAMLGHCIGGKRLGIVGMGRIGQAVAHRARAFGMEVVYHNRTRLPSSIENMFGASYEPDLDRLFTEADIVTLHAPAGTGTHHLVNADRLRTMKPDAYLINTARGDLIDEEALITALHAGEIAGAGLDVFAREPQVDPRLIALPNVITLPHLGSATVEGRAHAGEKVIANIRYWVDGHRPPDQVLQGWA